ncbi:MAG: indolepyruvate ferredoxin oxidoreductase family protein [Gammaproteobacteria bacterium]|nr:indolepyruvate ferredoxin oxidoreductase family protein [Gammaproteobacteria bacterium]MCP5426077.1 indolepyruvate ferredoxin oxidoreductase family protein [Gammaproteobacteria bacterium]
MAKTAASLDDKYTLEQGRVYLSGIQALVRLPMLQRQRDLAAGLNTAGFISGYRGSPLGGLDKTLWQARNHLDEHHIRFQPGVNEDLAATAVWGSQQVNLYPGAKYDGVFALWYGKGPGVDRSGDVFRHANAAGTSPHGGVLVVAGDDHAAKSSSLPHQTDHVFKGVMMPVLVPCGVQEYLDYGLHGWALSRYSGCWVAFKAIADTVESSASVEVSPQRVSIVLPEDFTLPPGGLNIRWPDPPLVQEERLLHYKLYAALAYCRANRLNRIMLDSPRPRLGIITSGKSYLDVRQALDDLGIDEKQAAEIGIRVYKVGMVWPLEAVGVRQFAEGVEEILVVEEKRQLLEYQIKEELYNWREDVRPRVIGKFDEKGEWALPHGDWLLPAASDLTPAMIARAIAGRIARFHTSERIQSRLAFLEAKEQALAQPHASLLRVPHYCPGCPHNTSTRVPEGSRALAGIGCHYMATWLSPATTQTFSQMGGEGVPWIGQAPFTETPHVFANLGDGTYFHSGLLAIRAAVAANVPITYKILYNDAVAMTGGQPVDGPLTVPQITRQLEAEGVERIVVVTDEPNKYRENAGFAPGVAIHPRERLDSVQRELREYPAVSALVYDQTCAAEKRRRRKRGLFPDPAKRVLINDRVCEGCGDCSTQSNCLSVAPLETELGRKRRIDQSSCNKDYSCLDGLCPSFVTVEGGRLRKGQALDVTEQDFPELPDPELPALDTPYGILVTGVGGAGVVTIGALLGMAAHLEGKGVTALDMMGLAQKGGAVWSHIRFAARPEQLYAARIAAGEANAVIGCDIVVTANNETLAKMQQGLTRAVVNSSQAITSEFVRTFAAQASSGDVNRFRDPQFPERALEEVIQTAVGEGQADFLDAGRLATALLGDSIATNLFMLGFAYQKGLVPVSEAALLQAIELNEVAIEANRRSFLWGRRAAHDRAAVERLVAPATQPSDSQRQSKTLDELIERRVQWLTAYQNAAYARRYSQRVEQVRQVESRIATVASYPLTEAVARYYYKLLAYKDEYEVARLYSDGAFLEQVKAGFEGDYQLVFHLAPPMLAKPDPRTGRPRKRRFGPWMLKAFRALALFKVLRGTRLDIFGGSPERQRERQLIGEYETLLDEILGGLEAENYPMAIELAALPEQIRGYGVVKQRYIEHTKQRETELLDAFRAKGRPREHRREKAEGVVVMTG